MHPKAWYRRVPCGHPAAGIRIPAHLQLPTTFMRKIHLRPCQSRLSAHAVCRTESGLVTASCAAWWRLQCCRLVIASPSNMHGIAFRNAGLSSTRRQTLARKNANFIAKILTFAVTAIYKTSCNVECDFMVALASRRTGCIAVGIWFSIGARRGHSIDGLKWPRFVRLRSTFENNLTY